MPNEPFPPTCRESRLAWVYLNAVAERPSAAMWDFIDRHGPIEAAERIRARALSGADAVSRQTEARAESVDPVCLLRRATEVGARFIHPGSSDWPALALAALDMPRVRRRIGDPADAAGSPSERDLATLSLVPTGLWVRGGGPRFALSDSRALAIVGTRDASQYGRSVAAEVAAAAVAEDAIVLSGGALGIDVAAHNAALANGGETAAVLARGIDEFYPSANAGTLARTAESAGVFSEYPPGTGVTRYRFLDRNRLIAALAGATVVVEASSRSGALSTARWASGLERPLAAVPGSIHSRGSAGCNALLRDHRAIVLASPGEVRALLPGHALSDVGAVSELQWERESAGSRPTGYVNGSGFGSRRATTAAAASAPPEHLDDTERRVFEALSGHRFRRPEELAAESGIPPAKVRVVLGCLFAEGLVERREGRWRRRKPQAAEQTWLPF